MNITLQHGQFTHEVDLSLLSDHYDYGEEVETWQEEVRKALGYDEDAEDAGEPPPVPYTMASYDGIPERLMGPTGPTEAFWEYFDVLEDKDKLDRWWAAEALGIPASDVEDAYQGQFNSDEEFAQIMADDMGLIQNDLSWPYNCISWPDAARELMSDYCAEDGWYFRIM